MENYIPDSDPNINENEEKQVNAPSMPVETFAEDMQERVFTPQTPETEPTPAPQPQASFNPPPAPQRDYAEGYRPPQQNNYMPPQNNGYVPPQRNGHTSFPDNNGAYTNPYHQPDNRYSQPFQPQPSPYNTYNPYMAPPKEKMSGGLKAIIIITISILVACLIGFSVYVISNNANKNTSDFNSFYNDGSNFFDNFEDEFDFSSPTSPSTAQTQPNKKTYEESNASDKVNKNFKGIELKEKPKDKNNQQYNASYTYKAVANSVVAVVCYYEEDIKTGNAQSEGTGIIVSQDGYIVTNSHVIGNSRKSFLIKVVTADKKEYKAGVVGYDSRSDLAVLKIDANNLPVATFGNSTSIEIAENVVAIGNPNGREYQNSITQGIVSALEREVSSSNNVKFIQTDAAINPGNSGGPLCNIYGQVIGINTAKIASQEYEGMGFAIPSATMKKIVDDIIRNGYVTNRVKIGITGIAVYEAEAGANGIQIEEITQGGPMDNTEAQTKDIITKVDGKEIKTFAEVFNILEQHREGDKVKLTLYRPSINKTFEIEIKLQIDKAEQ